MTYKEKAEIILKSLDECGVEINWNMEKFYLNGIMLGLMEVENIEVPKNEN